MRRDLICMRLADMYRRHPAQDNSRVCSRCSTQVGIYPSGQEALKRYPELGIVCHVCNEKEPQPKLTILAPGAEKEPFESYDHPRNQTRK